MLVDLVNADFPDEFLWGRAEVSPGQRYQYRELLVKRLRAQTEKFWPELWISGEESALGVLREIRNYLRRFWSEQDELDRDWHIHRLREYHHLQILHPDRPGALEGYRDPQTGEPRGVLGLQTIEARERLEQFLREFRSAETADDARNASSWVNVGVKMLLDEPPRRTPFADALIALQRRALISSKAPRYCDNNPDCRKPYFLSKEKNQRFCTRVCAHASELASKRGTWTKNKDKYNTKRRTK